MRPRLKRFILLSPLFLLGALVFIAIGGGLVRWLWNWLLPPLFGWPAVTFWQALALLALCRILFGGWRSGGGSSGSHWRRRMRERITARYEGMTPEEREEYRRRIRERWGFDPAAGTRKESSQASMVNLRPRRAISLEDE